MQNFKKFFRASPLPIFWGISLILVANIGHAATDEYDDYTKKLKEKLAAEDASQSDEEKTEVGDVIGPDGRKVTQKKRQSYSDQLKKEVRERDREEYGTSQGVDVQSRNYSGIEKHKLVEEAREHGMDPVPEGSYTFAEKKKLEPLKPTGSAIADVKDGKSDLKMIRSGFIHNAVQIAVGSQVARNFSATDDSFTRDFDSVYPLKKMPEINLHYERQFIHNEVAGALGLSVDLGFTFFNGIGTFEFAPKRASGGSFDLSSTTKFRFFMLPVAVGGIYRMKLFKYVQPFVSGGATMTYCLEHRDDNEKDKHAFIPGFQGSGGISFMLDWLHDDSTWNLYADHQVKHYYLTGQFFTTGSFMSSVNLARTVWVAGLTYEF